MSKQLKRSALALAGAFVLQAIPAVQAAQVIAVESSHPTSPEQARPDVGTRPQFARISQVRKVELLPSTSSPSPHKNIDTPSEKA